MFRRHTLTIADLQVQIKRNILREKILRPAMSFLKAGMSPEQLAIAFSLGIVAGVIPLLGSTTLLCFVLAFALRLNMAAIQLVSYLVFPLQLLFFIPFFQAGGYFFQPLEVPLSVAQISEMMSANFWGTIRQFWFANLQALLVWLILAIPSFLLLYFILSKSLRKIALAISDPRNQN